MRSFKRKEKAASSTPGIPAFRNAVTGRLDSEKPRFQVWKAADERKHRAVSGHGIPGAMLVFSQTFSKGAVLPTGVHPILRVRVELSPQWEQRNDSHWVTALGLSTFLQPLRSEKERHWKH